MIEGPVTAIVLRRVDSGESDRRLTLLTLEAGKIDVVAKGARKSASRLAGCSDPLTVSIMSLAKGKRNSFVTQAQPLASYRGLRTDYERLSLAMALAELFAVTTPWHEPLPEAYELLAASLSMLEEHAKPLIAFIWSEMRLLRITGFEPMFGACVVTGTPIAEAQPFVSPMAGGYISNGVLSRYTDRFQVRAEVLYGLSRLADFDDPPGNMKFAEEAVRALLPFWRNVAELPLPANASVIEQLWKTDLEP